ncbi:class I SAM-dependent methyltransferase [Mucisphaera sp.]|uniref:class I SAM-dependent methyltransferase n=1 Tax=Mucisphaera sp. TaxID=2913024 RepID=UPI003D0FA305
MPANAKRPHRLALYTAAVQNPLAEVALIEKVCRHHHLDDPLLLREDFAGTAALATAWVASDPERQAIALDHHAPTTRWAAREAGRILGQRVDDLHLVCADVHELSAPRTQVTAVLNFSICELHTRPALLGYLRHARRCLQKDGVLILDIFGGPGSQLIQTQSQEHAHPAHWATGEPTPPFTYHWEQRAFDHASQRIDCRIHFGFDDGSTLKSAFRYDWRLWSPAELPEALEEAGFREVTLWCDRYHAGRNEADNRFRPTNAIPSRHDYIAYLTAQR